ncbi:helix-turn-helix domain-containing protein [Streptomyces odontomachi]|uniref:helix-turn-helix domain-containing protein n=1 Tax=Streptomyces odontomachi TaxID=2944940 RepID=UPI00210928E6|nr:helix-turn-helix transcriptional regulator [Streptomyces sp. ODS25]
MPSPSSSVQQARETFGLRLRAIRKDAGLTCRELARRAGWHESKCSRLEHGRTPPSDDDIRSWATLCQAQDQIPDLIASARGIDGMYIEWRHRTRAGMRSSQEAVLPLYERTRHMRVYEPGVIPGLLQTASYARALMGAIIAFQHIPDDTEAAVAARLHRQKVLHEGGRTFAFLVEESALRARVAPDDVMAGQLGHLLSAAAFPQVSLGVIPASAVRGMWPVEGFWIFDEERVLVDLVTAEITVTQPREITLYERTFSALADLAVYGTAARSVITSAIDALG